MIVKQIMLRLIALFTFVFLLFNVSGIRASDNQATDSANPVVVVDSYVLFWPLVSGSTLGDSSYSLKLFKETLMGWFTFGDNKKANYAIFLGTKRVLEAEKLIKENKDEPAQKTLDNAAVEYAKAYDYVKIADKKGSFSAKEIRVDRIVNAKFLIDSIKASKSGDLKGKLEGVEEKINALRRDYLP